MFASALANVRRCGGVLEHPAWSKAWEAYGLPIPMRSGGWFGDEQRGWSCYVEQGRYGHVAKKATWLYAFGCDLPELRWGHDPDTKSAFLVSWCGNTTKAHDKRPRVGKAAAATPPEFRAVLLGMARSVRPIKVTQLSLAL